MGSICIFEDEKYNQLYPLSYFRPVFDLICGIKRLRERIVSCFADKDVYYLCREYLKPNLIEILNISDNKINSIPNGNVLFINGRVLIDEELVSGDREEIGVNGETIVYANLKSETIETIKEYLTSEVISNKILDKLKDKVPTKEVSVQIVNYPWDLVNNNGKLMELDFVNPKMEGFIDNGCTIYGDRTRLSLGENSRIEANVVLNLESGPVYISKNVTVRGPTIIDGPCFIGKNSLIDGAKIRSGVYIGETCKIAGEVEESIIDNFSNKHHDGFLGHAYLGEWVNIGALATNSDLKNNYGNIRVIIDGKEIDSQNMKVGCFIGDHTKLGIGVMLNTGTNIGPFCNVFGVGLQPKYIKGFSWGGINEFTEHKLEKAIESSKKAMVRRNINQSDNYEELIRKVKEIIFRK